MLNGKIINWLIEYTPNKIIGTLLDCMILPDKYRYRLIFLTQNFNLLDKNFVRRYVLKKPITTDNTDKTNTTDTTQNNNLNDISCGNINNNNI